MNKYVNRCVNLFSQVNYRMVDIEVKDKIGHIKMNSQKNLNALSFDMKANLIKNIKDFETSNDVKAIIISSAIKKAFCVGANIKEFEGKKAVDFKNNDIFKEIHDTLDNAKKPIIAAVNGLALGGGFELALLCDIIYCSEEAQFCLPELQLGLIPGIGGTQRLTKIIGRTNAMSYILASKTIKAQRAFQLGIVANISTYDTLHSDVINAAKQIVSKPSTAIIAAKQAIKAAQNYSMKQGIAFQRQIFYPLFDTPAVKEGISSFVQKKKPNFIDL